MLAMFSGHSWTCAEWEKKKKKEPPQCYQLSEQGDVCLLASALML